MKKKRKKRKKEVGGGRPLHRPAVITNGNEKHNRTKKKEKARNKIKDRAQKNFAGKSHNNGIASSFFG